MLPPDTFNTIVRHTPLVSIDLVVESFQDRILLGMRNNRPAKDWWFVPGGVINKDERIEQAFERLTAVELGMSIPLSQGTFLGVYEHLYDDNFAGTDFTTHYVVLAYRIRLEQEPLKLPKEQHNAYRWFEREELLADNRVHDNSKAYFPDLSPHGN